MKSRVFVFATVGVVASLLAVIPCSALASTASWAVTPSLIQGSGSSWAENAINQWVADVFNEGVQVVYNPDGDAAGRQDFANRTVDFAVTANGYQGIDPSTGQSDTSDGRPYVYLPIAAGGTSFPYQIHIDGKQVETLRLSGETLAKIFTDQITNWDNPAITADNNGVQLPSLPITPVVQAEGSGATQQLTEYFAAEYPQIWQTFSGSTAATEYWPRQGDQIAENGSNQAMNFVQSSEANGSITYVEYSFALSVNYPVAKILNSAGFYTLPTQYNVAVALEKAQINMDKSSPDYLLQNLANVYTDPDPRTYPLSSYVYMIEPTGTDTTDPTMTSGIRQALADFEYYDICQGQKELGPIGYSPLPVNLVEAAFGQIKELQAADPSVDLTNLNILTCDNPTFIQGQPNENYLAKIAPMPPSCDHVGSGPCAAGVTPNGIGSSPTVSGTVSSGRGSKSSSGTATQSSTAPVTTGTPAGQATKASSGGKLGTHKGRVAATLTTVPRNAYSGPSSAGSNTPTLVSETLPENGFTWADALALIGVLLLLFAFPVTVGVRRARRKI